MRLSRGRSPVEPPPRAAGAGGRAERSHRPSGGLPPLPPLPPPWAAARPRPPLRALFSSAALAGAAAATAPAEDGVWSGGAAVGAGRGMLRLERASLGRPAGTCGMKRISGSKRRRDTRTHAVPMHTAHAPRPSGCRLRAGPPCESGRTCCA